MDWQTLLWIGGLVALVFVMMRGCGMGSRGRDPEADSRQGATRRS